MKLLVTMSNKINKDFENYLKDSLPKIKNLGIIAHIDAGKTTFTERVLYYAGLIYKIGEVHEGSAITDSMAQERERGITIASAAITYIWRDYRHNLIDTPGHIDFNFQVEVSLSVLDGAITVIDASAGVQSQTECVWNQANKYKVSRIVFINKMDKDGANFDKAYESLNNKLSNRCIYIQYPVIEDFVFVGIYDLVEKKKYKWQGRDHIYTEIELSQEDIDFIQSKRIVMIEKMTLFNEEILQEYLENGDIDNQKLYAFIKSMTVKCDMYPVVCGSAFHNKGIQSVLDAIVNYLPSPSEKVCHARKIVPGVSVKDCEVEEISCYNNNFIGFVFKIVFDKYSGAIYYIRIYSGYLSVGDFVHNVKKGKKYKIQNIFRFFADKKTALDIAYSGDIVGITIEEATTSDTLCSLKNDYLIEKIDINEPVVDVSFTPATRKDQDNFSKYIQFYLMEDPTIKYRYNENEAIISGVGKLQIEILKDRLKTERNVNIILGKPRISFKRTLTKSYTHEYLHKKQSGGSGQFAGVTITVEPSEEKYIFVDKISKGSIPKQYIPEIDKAIRETLYGDGSAPYIGVKVTLIDGRYHSVDSSSIAYYLATRYCLLEALKECGTILLEPISKINIYTPGEYMSAIISDLYSKNGRIISVDRDEDRVNDYRYIVSECPLRQLFDYADVVRSLSKGMAYSSMVFVRYEECKEDVGINLE
ncbi:Elongation factor G [bacterium AB1]|nr:Elongation factor G [bacterium AB1]